jgi:glycerate kinase
VRTLAGAGAAGGLAGGLAVAGALLHSGFDVVADEVGLYDLVTGADLIVTAEGFLDEQSFEGKVVGGVVELAAEAGIPCSAIVGEVVDHPGAVPEGVGVVSLVERFGEDRAHHDTVACIEEAAAEIFAAQRPGLAPGRGPSGPLP